MTGFQILLCGSTNSFINLINQEDLSLRTLAAFSYIYQRGYVTSSHKFKTGKITFRQKRQLKTYRFKIQPIKKKIPCKTVPFTFFCVVNNEDVNRRYTYSS
jgi:hypothetical protein